MMFGMFSFLLMAGNSAERNIATYKEGDVFVDTCTINDSDKPYETAVSHPAYNNNKLIIVELYNTKKEAQKGHDKWVNIMTTNPLPRVIDDVSTSDIVKFAEAMGINLKGPREKGENSQ